MLTLFIDVSRCVILRDLEHACAIAATAASELILMTRLINFFSRIIYVYSEACSVVVKVIICNLSCVGGQIYYGNYSGEQPQLSRNNVI